MIATCLTLAAMLAFVLFPLLIPVTVHVVHAVRSWAAARTISYPQPVAPGRVTVATALS